MERLYNLVFAAKRMVKGAATLTSFALEPFSFILNQWKGSIVLFLPQNAWLKGLPL